MHPGITHILSLCSDELPRHADISYKIVSDLPDKPGLTAAITTQTHVLFTAINLLVFGTHAPILTSVFLCLLYAPVSHPPLTFRPLGVGTRILSRLADLCDYIQV